MRDFKTLKSLPAFEKTLQGGRHAHEQLLTAGEPQPYGWG